MSEVTLEEALRKGVEAHRANQFADAEKYYSAILKAQPANPDANHNMGVLKVGINKAEQALPFFLSAIEAKPTIIQYWVSYIKILIKLGKVSDARRVLTDAKSKFEENDHLINLENSLENFNISKKLDSNAEPFNNKRHNILDTVKLDRALTLANKYIQIQSYEEAQKIYQDILERFPKNRKSAQALKAISKNSLKEQKILKDPSQEKQKSLIKSYSEGKAKTTLKEAKELLSSYPNSIFLFNIIGAVSHQLKDFDTAILSYKKAIAIKPDFADAYNNIGNVLRDKGQFEEAEKAYKKALSINPKYIDAYINMGNVLHDKGNLCDAVEIYEKAISIAPNNAEAHYNVGNALRSLGQLEKAITSYKKAIEFKGNHANAFNNLGNCLKELGHLNPAMEAYKNSLELDAEFTSPLINMGTIYSLLGKSQEALNCYNKAIKLNPLDADALNNMGNIFNDLGEQGKARESYQRAIKIQPEHTEAHSNLSRLVRYTADHPHFKLVKQLYKRNNLNLRSKKSLTYTLAKMYEDTDNYKKAFEYLKKFNDLENAELNYEIADEKVVFEKLKETQKIIAKNSLADVNSTDPVMPIFILGMPRSGTTLVEQIISNHPQVFGAGELNYVGRYGFDLATGKVKPTQEDLVDFKVRYFASLKERSEGCKIVSDKMPQNFRFIPLICATIPEAKIIHVHRHPSATCWSIFRQRFEGRGLGFSYSLQNIVDYYRLYKELMRHWEVTYSGRIYHVNYDDLTENQEVQTKCLIDHLGLDWDGRCLKPETNQRSVRTASQIQVRNAVYTGSSKTWENYKPFLNNVFDNL